MKPFIRLLCCISVICVLLFSCSDKNIPPLVFDQEFSIDENSSSGTFVGLVYAEDFVQQGLTYSILDGNTNSAFSISETEGIITVLNDEVIDFETTPVFSLLVKVTDKKGESSETTVTVNINDLTPPATGLKLYLPFDGNINDSSPYENDGINYTSGNFVTGKWNTGLDFNGTTDYIELTNNFNAADGISFSCWVKTRGVNGLENNGVIISKYAMTGHLRCFLIWSFGGGDARYDNRLSAAFYPDRFSSSIHDYTRSYLEASELSVFPDPLLWTIVNPIRLATGTWMHCVVNMKPASLEIWINNVLRTKKQREYNSYFDSNDVLVYIGNCPSLGAGSNNHFNGVLDELRVYDRSLSIEEIKLLYKEK